MPAHNCLHCKGAIGAKEGGEASLINSLSHQSNKLVCSTWHIRTTECHPWSRSTTCSNSPVKYLLSQIVKGDLKFCLPKKSRGVEDIIPLYILGTPSYHHLRAAPGYISQVRTHMDSSNRREQLTESASTPLWLPSARPSSVQNPWMQQFSMYWISMQFHTPQLQVQDPLLQRNHLLHQMTAEVQHRNPLRMLNRSVVICRYGHDCS